MAARPTATVECEIQLQLIVPGDRLVPLPVRLRYAADDPYALHAQFITGAQESVDWVFARELLSQGLREPAGDGDVRVRPGTGEHLGQVHISLTSPDGQALLLAPAARLTTFLDATYELVPDGAESVNLDLDRVVQALLH